jgi:hypothetical protein
MTHKLMINVEWQGPSSFNKAPVRRWMVFMECIPMRHEGSKGVGDPGASAEIQWEKISIRSWIEEGINAHR